MLDRVIEGWQVTHFARVFVAEHAPGHELPRGGKRFEYGETVVTIYRAPKPRKVELTEPTEPTERTEPTEPPPSA